MALVCACAQPRCRASRAQQAASRKRLHVVYHFHRLVLHQLQRAAALHPVAAAVLDELLELDLAVVDAGDDAEVLAHVVALLDAVQVGAGLHQRVGLLVLRERADHLDRSSGKASSGSLRPVQVRRELADAAARAGLARRRCARAGTGRSWPSARVGDRLVGLHLRQRIDPAAQVLGQSLASSCLQVAVLLAAARGEQRRPRAPRSQRRSALRHFLPALLRRGCCALRCAATSSSSR